MLRSWGQGGRWLGRGQSVPGSEQSHLPPGPALLIHTQHLSGLKTNMLHPPGGTREALCAPSTLSPAAVCPTALVLVFSLCSEPWGQAHPPRTPAARSTTITCRFLLSRWEARGSLWGISPRALALQVQAASCGRQTDPPDLSVSCREFSLLKTGLKDPVRSSRYGSVVNVSD